ncbi:MAG: HD domain-containing protein [Oscillospiraceae bacterium]|nr:HD domain-containing protein [Oscillospiraceae bacterium]
MQYIRLQLGCVLILLFVGFLYSREARYYNVKNADSAFYRIYWLGIINLLCDAASSFCVNNLDIVPPMVNVIIQILFLYSLDLIIISLCLYYLYLCGIRPRTRMNYLLVYLPIVISAILVFVTAGQMTFVEHPIADYVFGTPAYICYVLAAIYLAVTIAVLAKHWKNIERNKRMGLLTYMALLGVTATAQIILPYILVTSIAVTAFTLSSYIYLEDPALKKIKEYQSETVVRFANLIESRDNSTGEHIKRTSIYVQLIAQELRDRNLHVETLTDDYINNLVSAAPMHDIGKVSVPDAILQKPGKLTPEEFEIIKLHTVNGCKILEENFRNIGSRDYYIMARDVALFHHEKWNGKGYPEGRSGNDIPLSARIMSIADVFDAVSEKRCYRDAMPLDECFSIIENGRGTDFDPEIVDAFLAISAEIRMVHSNFVN